MDPRPDDLEARLGRTLAETARINNPGRAAAQAVHQASPQGARAARNRRGLRIALAVAALALVALALLALRFAPG